MKRPVAAVALPVVRQGEVVSVLDMTLAPTLIATLLVGRDSQAPSVAVVADSRLEVIGRWPEDAAGSGEKLPAWLAGAVFDRVGGVEQGTWNDGSERIFAFARPRLAPTWLIAVSKPLGAYQATWRGPLVTQLLAALAALVVGGFAATSLGLFLARQLTALTSFARAFAVVADHGPDPVRRCTVTEFEALRLSLSRAEAVLRRRAAAEKMALREARTGHELLASVVNGTAEGIFVKDLDGRYVLVNRAALSPSCLGMEEWHVLGRQAPDVLPAEIARQVEQADRDVLDRSGGTHTFDAVFTRGDGEIRVFSFTNTPWRDAEGKLAGVVTVAHDVTDQRNAEQRLRAVQADLLRATRLSAMGAMASGLAHELNQPLAAATNFLNAAARMLHCGTAEDEPPPARAAVAEAAQQLLRAGTIVRRLRDFVGRGEAELQSEDVALLIREACDVAHSDGATAGCTLTVQVGDAGAALVDRTQIQQVLLNLIRNAAEAMQGVSLRRITVAAGRTAAGGVEITVADTGPGLAPGVADRLFQPFVSTKVNGMGIGLAICRTIVEGHGGRLSAEPQVGGGMLFRIVLPPVKPSGAIDV
jgi:two-component system sensor kinase FixL